MCGKQEIIGVLLVKNGEESAGIGEELLPFWKVLEVLCDKVRRGEMVKAEDSGCGAGRGTTLSVWLARQP